MTGLARRRVAVLGAGIMGSATALHLARRGVDVTLFDEAEAPFTGASRWNEGKIHLGFLYAADPTLDTARAILGGGLDFGRQVEQLTGIDLDGLVTPGDDIYLVHRDSVVAPDAVGGYFDAVAEVVRDHPDAARYLIDMRDAHVSRLTADEIGQLADPAVIDAGFRVPERSVSTTAVADAFIAALAADDRIEVRLGARVTGAVPSDGDEDGPWWVLSGDERVGPFDGVVNALWAGRPELDRAVGFRPDVAEQHRYRVATFVQTDRDLPLESTLVAVGPFGDVKNYGGGRFYVSWYPAGLLATGESVVPPPQPAPDDVARAALAEAMFAGLGAIVPGVRTIQEHAVSVEVAGGWVYAQARGRLDDPAAGIHRRDRLGIASVGSYHSVDTGKYSVAPTLAEVLADRITAF